ncbi:hypothetical protein K7X08_006432 [Anisodus acutangulus]|uniref:Uncharacterized protein n=1 Tax=Anisodus acutangulus TaxID=402998 RepID=A0A9Q1MYU7_9SOLA|nr:hypothetical protein K7X08_006432 [Anisodus acutangulus]
MDVDKIEEARAMAHLRVGELKASGLLLESDKEGCIKMHDMVRDFAISIASGENHRFLIKSGRGLNEWPRRETFEQHVVISLMSKNVPVLPDGLNCPKLEMLLLGENEGFELIPDDFFAGMRFLKVLDLSERAGVRSLNLDYGLVPNISLLLSSLKFPSSFKVLIKLQVLSLDHCTLDDMSILGKLKGLEILSLYGSNIKELPDEIGDLNNLRLLDLTFCQSLERIPEKLVSNLRRLEEFIHGRMLYALENWQWITGRVLQSMSF